MALKFWRENFYVLFPVPCSSFPEKSGNYRELPGSRFWEFPNWHNLNYGSIKLVLMKLVYCCSPRLKFFLITSINLFISIQEVDFDVNIPGNLKMSRLLSWSYPPKLYSIESFYLCQKNLMLK